MKVIRERATFGFIARSWKMYVLQFSLKKPWLMPHCDRRYGTYEDITLFGWLFVYFGWINPDSWIFDKRSVPEKEVHMGRKKIDVVRKAQNASVDPYQQLANAIILQAVADYRGTTSKREIETLEKFFRSDYYKMLTDLDGEAIISGFRREKRMS